MVFAIVALVGKIVSAVFAVIGLVIQTVIKAIAVVVSAGQALLTKAVKFTLSVVKASHGWMKAVGSKLITSVKAGVKAGWDYGLAHLTWGTVAKAAGMNAAWSGIQTARHGGSWTDIFRSAAKGAVIGAIGAVTGAFMHGFGAGAGSWASSAAEVAAAGGQRGLTGTMLHAAAHGVSGGAMASANGGSFKDGFIGGAIGFGVGLPFGGIRGMIHGSGLGAIAARTAIAAVGGGVGSKLSGGSFADGAYSAAFFHLFNNEIKKPRNIWNDEEMARMLKVRRFSTIVLYDGADLGGPPVIGDDGLLVDQMTGIGFKGFAEWIVGNNKHLAVDISQDNWEKQYALAIAKASQGGGATALMIVDHGWPGAQEFGIGDIDPRGELWTRITRPLPETVRLVTLCGCHVAKSPRGLSYLRDFSQYSQRPGLTVQGYTGQFVGGNRRYEGQRLSAIYQWR